MAVGHSPSAWRELYSPGQSFLLWPIFFPWLRLRLARKAVGCNPSAWALFQSNHSGFQLESHLDGSLRAPHIHPPFQQSLLSPLSSLFSASLLSGHGGGRRSAGSANDGRPTEFPLDFYAYALVPIFRYVYYQFGSFRPFLSALFACAFSSRTFSFGTSASASPTSLPLLPLRLNVPLRDLLPLLPSRRFVALRV